MVVSALEIDAVLVNEAVFKAVPMLVVVPALDWDSMSVPGELLHETGGGTNVVTVSVSSTVVYEVNVLVGFASVCPAVGSPT
jgi:hypothetical protein